MNVIDERDGGTLFGFADLEGNGWVVQQIKSPRRQDVEPTLSAVSGTARSVSGP
jgi:hypothetical protein